MASKPIDWREPFLAALREVPVVRYAADKVGMNRTAVYHARTADPAFAEAWDQAMEDGIDRAEEEAMRRAVVGFDEPVVHKGQLTPLYEHDEHGNIVHEKRPTGHFDEDGEPVYSLEPKPLMVNGRPQFLTVRKHSDALLALVLKGRRKKVYAERTEITGADGGPMSTVDETTKAARLARLMALAQQRKDLEDIA